MAVMYNNLMDDPLVFDASRSFEGGENSEADPSNLSKNQCAKLINAALDKVGDITTRKGTSLLGDAAVAAGRVQGIGELDTPSVEKILAAVSGTMFQWNGSAWSAAAGYTPVNSSVMVEIVQGIDLLFIADGSSNLRSWDGTTFTNLGTGSPAPPIFSRMVWHKNMLIGFTSNSDVLYASTALPSNMASGFDYTNRSFRVGGGEGDNLVAVASWSDFNLAAFKHNFIYVVNANPALDPDEWEVRKVSDRVGCVAHRSVKMVGNDLFFLSRDGVRSLMRTLTESQSETSAPLSFSIQPLIDRINWDAVETSCAEFIDNKYLLAVPLDNATQPNAVLVWDARLKVWCGYWSGEGWTPSIFHLSKLNNELNFYFGNTQGKVIRWDYDADDDLESSYEDQGEPIATTLRTPSYFFDDIVSPKSGWNIEFEFNKSLAEASVFAILDQNEDLEPIEADFDTFGPTNQLPVDLPFDLAILTIWRRAFDLAELGEFREIQFEVTTTEGKLALKQLIASAFLNTMRYES